MDPVIADLNREMNRQDKEEQLQAIAEQNAHMFIDDALDEIEYLDPFDVYDWTPADLAKFKQSVLDVATDMAYDQARNGE